MSKEQAPKLKDMSEEQLRMLFEQAEADKDYSLQVLICRALLPYEERPCLALTEIKKIEELAKKSNESR